MEQNKRILLIVEASEEHNTIWKRYIREDRFDGGDSYLWDGNYPRRIIDGQISFASGTKYDGAIVLKSFAQNRGTYGVYLKLPLGMKSLPRDPKTEPTPRAHDGLPITLTAAAEVSMRAYGKCAGCEAEQSYGFIGWRFFNVYCQDIVDEKTGGVKQVHVYVLYELLWNTGYPNFQDMRSVNRREIDCNDLCYETTGHTCAVDEDGILIPPPSGPYNSLPLFKKDTKVNPYSEITEIECSSNPVTFTPRDHSHVMALYEKIDGCWVFYFFGYDIELLFQPGSYEWELYELNPCIPTATWTLIKQSTFSATTASCWQSSWNLKMWGTDCVTCEPEACNWQYKLKVKLKA